MCRFPNRSFVKVEAEIAAKDISKIKVFLSGRLKLYIICMGCTTALLKRARGGKKDLMSPHYRPDLTRQLDRVKCFD